MVSLKIKDLFSKQVDLFRQYISFNALRWYEHFKIFTNFVPFDNSYRYEILLGECFVWLTLLSSFFVCLFVSSFVCYLVD